MAKLVRMHRLWNGGAKIAAALRIHGATVDFNIVSTRHGDNVNVVVVVDKVEFDVPDIFFLVAECN